MKFERLNDIEYSEIFYHIKNGTLENYLNGYEDGQNIRFDIEHNGTRPIATWIEDINISNNNAVDICLEIRDGKPYFYERLDFDDNTIEIFDKFDDAMDRMKHDVVNYEKEKSENIFGGIVR